MRCATCGRSLVGARFDHEALCNHSSAMRSNGQIANVHGAEVPEPVAEQDAPYRLTASDFQPFNRAA
jgi:hypothetical protein